MTIQEKYATYLPLAKPGDIILFKGTAFISKAIALFDKAYFTHSAVVGYVWAPGILSPTIIQSTIDSKGNGMQTYRLNNELQGDLDFVVLRPYMATDAQIEAGIAVLQEKIKEGAKYNKLFYIKFLIYLATKIDIKDITQRNAYVCSQAVQLFTDSLGLPEYKTEDLITPQYIWDHMDKSNLEIIIDKG